MFHDYQIRTITEKIIHKIFLFQTIIHQINKTNNNKVYSKRIEKIFWIIIIAKITEKIIFTTIETIVMQ